MKFKYLFLFTALCFQSLIAEIWEPSSLTSFQIVSTKAKKDFIVDFEDNSSWKIHPDDIAKVSDWQVGDEVHVRIRNSFYWFKRDHKFSIYNHTRDEAAKAMIQFHRDIPREIIEASDIFCTKGKEVPLYRLNSKGELVIYGYLALETAHRKILMMDDGSQWELKDHLDDFNEGTTIYVGFHDNNDLKLPFLISGKGKSAVWSTLYPLPETRPLEDLLEAEVIE